MNLKQRKEKDWQIISAYLDGHLSAKEVNSFEARIQNDSDLADMLEKIKWTRSLLKQAPRRKVPHQFILTRQMAAEIQHQQKGLVWRYGLVSGMASLIFLALAGFQLLPMMGMTGNLAMAPKEAIVEEMSIEADGAESGIAVYDEVVVEETEMEAAPMMMQEAPVEEESMEVQAEALGTVEEQAVEEPMTEEEELMDAAPAAAEEVPVEPSGGGGTPPTPTPVPAEISTMVLDDVETGAEEPAENIEPRAEDQRATFEDGEYLEDSEVNSEATLERMAVEEMIPADSNYSRLAWGEIFIFGGMLVSAIVALFMLVAAFRAKNRY